jgi:teichuronic acid biosynthesis glycosyltransferase TuaC
MSEPRILVFSSLFPSAVAPTAGTFIRERMLRVARDVPLVVVAPQAWSPFDGLVRLIRRSFRPQAVAFERIGDVEVHRPRFVSIPGIFKRWDGMLMARGARATVERIAAEFRPTLVDAHFVYPDGYAASILAERLSLPLTITLRGSKDEWLIGTDREPMMRAALARTTRIFAVSESLKQDVGVRLGQAPDKILVVRNGVDTKRFHPVDRAEARRRLGIAPEARVVIGVGGLIERKGFHRVIPEIARLAVEMPDLRYLIVGGGTTQADMRGRLEAMAAAEGVAANVVFCGPQSPDDLKWFYGAADVFALATEHEGWANVFLEAMACGLPVVTTAVGGNAQVVSHPGLGALVPFWEPAAFADALRGALSANRWDRDAIVAHACANGWDAPVALLLEQFRSIGRP